MGAVLVTPFRERVNMAAFNNDNAGGIIVSPPPPPVASPPRDTSAAAALSLFIFNFFSSGLSRLVALQALI
jgi:hypothetical protein